jgi:hypothetical protein
MRWSVVFDKNEWRVIDGLRGEIGVELASGKSSSCKKEEELIAHRYKTSTLCCPTLATTHNSIHCSRISTIKSPATSMPYPSYLQSIKA